MTTALQDSLPLACRLLGRPLDAALTSSLSWKRRELEEFQLSHLALGFTASFFPHHWVSFQVSVFSWDDMWVTASSASVKQLS